MNPVVLWLLERIFLPLVATALAKILTHAIDDPQACKEAVENYNNAKTSEEKRAARRALAKL